MSTHAAHRRWWQIFEVVFGIPVLAAIALQFALPLSLPPGFQMPTLILGVAFVLTGLVLVVLARRQFVQHQQPTDPGRSTSQLITTGVFSISRNPLYLGGICIVLGVALALNLPWLLLFLLPALIACHYILVVPEERYLARTFGEQYRAYAAAVHRWIGRTRSTKDA